MRGLVRNEQLPEALEQLSFMQKAAASKHASSITPPPASMISAESNSDSGHSAVVEPLVELTYLAVSKGVAQAEDLLHRLNDSKMWCKDDANGVVTTRPSIILPPDALLALAECCAKNKNTELARAVVIYRSLCVPIPKLAYGAYDALLACACTRSTTGQPSG